MSIPVARSLSGRSDRSGQSMPFVAVMMIGLLGMAALAVDIGHLFQVRAWVQAMSDASALAAAQELPSETDTKAMAADVATLNDPDHGTIVDPDEVEVGHWDGFGTFTPGGSPVNAVRVVARRTLERGNPVPTFFARILGRDLVDVVTYATATAGASGEGVSTLTRFIIDEEIFHDPAKKELEDLAASMGHDFDWITSDNDGDWFIDIPPGTEMWMPTGQEGDEALFDISHEAFPFTDGSNGNPAYEDFLNYNEDSNSWRYDLIDKDDLDPLLGVKTVSHAHTYPEIIEPLLHKCQVSPMYKSDVSTLNPVDGVPAVNALGERRGLFAFSIEELGEPPPDGSSSDLPMLLIKVWDPVDCNVTWDETQEDRVRLVFGGTLPIRLVQ